MATRKPKSTAKKSSSASSHAKKLHDKGIHLAQSTTIQAPAAVLFQFWRQFTNLPRFMKHLKEVQLIDNRRSHWKAKAPLGSSVEWDAIIINEQPDKLIAWRSTEGADVDSAGSVRFVETADRGTDVHVVMDYIPPAGRLGKFIAKLFGEDPDSQIREDLNRFRKLMEKGSVSPK